MGKAAITRLCIIFLSVATLIGVAQEWRARQPVHYTITDDNGLPSNEVYQVVQDNFGYLWIGCDAGLYRYDGTEFRYYTSSRQNSRSVSGLQLDANGTIWCKNFTGQVFRVESDSLRVVCDLTGRVSSVFPFTLDDAGNLFVGMKRSIVQFNHDGDSIASIDVAPNDSTSLLPIQDMIYYKQRLYCFLPRAGIFCVNPVSSTVQKVLTEVEHWNSVAIGFFLNNGKLHGLRSDNSKRQYSLSVLHGDSMTVYHEYLPHEGGFRIHAVCSDRDDQLWLCTSAGAFRFDATVVSLNTADAIYKTEKISWLLHDKENQYWFTTLNSGLIASPSLEVCMLDPENSALGEKQVTAISCFDQNTLLAGTYGGLMYHVDPINDSVAAFIDDGLKKYYAVKSFTDASNYFIVAHGVTEFIDRKTEERRLMPIANARDVAIAGDTAFFILPEAFAAVSLSDFEKNNAQTDIVFIRKTGGRAIEFNPADGLLYVAFNDGVFTYSAGRLEPVTLNGHPVFANALSAAGGVTWVACVNDGVVGFQNGNVVARYSAKEGLKESNVRTLFAVNDTVIACTNEQLYTICTKAKQVNSYDITEGINPKDVSAVTMCGEQIWLATNKGLLHFPFDLPGVNTVRPNISITGISLDGTALSADSSCSLPYGNSNLVIQFSSVALRSRGKAVFQYRMIGLDSNWITSPWVNRSVTYPNLPPGEYRFEVRAVNESGFSSEKPANFSFTVEQPVWQTWWFYVFATILLVGAVLAITTLRIRSVGRRAEMKNKMALSQLTALKAQMNPHFMYNALNSIQDLVLQQDVKNATLYLGKFSRLMRKVLEASGKEEITLGDEIELLGLYLELEKLRMGDQFTYAITRGRDVDDNIRIPSMILQPFVENALKHGLLHLKGDKLLTIDFSLENDLICTVTDNGIGREKSALIRRRQEHPSFATEATEKRIDLLNAFRDGHYSIAFTDLKDGDVAKGTRVTIRIPLG